MDKIFLALHKKVITERDRTLACDYIDWYGIDPTEYKEYADSFVAECYDFNEQTGEHEETTPDKLPFADCEKLENGDYKYTYRDCSVIKQSK